MDLCELCPLSKSFPKEIAPILSSTRPDIPSKSSNLPNKSFPAASPQFSLASISPPVYRWLLMPSSRLIRSLCKSLNYANCLLSVGILTKKRPQVIEYINEYIKSSFLCIKYTLNSAVSYSQKITRCLM